MTINESGDFFNLDANNQKGLNALGFAPPARGEAD